jgi:hypothetical protein
VSLVRVYALVEGQTEEVFVKGVLADHLAGLGILVTPVIVATKRVAGGGKYRGGIVSWTKFERELIHLLGDSGATTTTLVDYYGLPTDWPGCTPSPHHGRRRAEHIESEMARVVNRPNFIPHLMLHEFEALVFASPAEAARLSGDATLATRLAADVTAAGGAEGVNDGPSTHPSARLRRYWPGYVKPADGPTIATRAGLAALRAACPHLDEWVATLEGLPWSRLEGGRFG